MENLVFTQLSIPELRQIFRQELETYFAIQEQSNKSNNNNSQIEFLTRHDAKKLLGISFPTLHDWTISGRIKGYRIGTRVRYKRHEIETALKAIQTPSN